MSAPLIRCITVDSARCGGIDTATSIERDRSTGRLHIPGYPPTYSDNIRPFVPGYPPSFDALP